MNDKMNRGFSIVGMVVVSLSILAIVAAPVMTENATDVEEAFSGELMYDGEEHLKSNVTGLETESFSATLESMPLLPATTTFTPDITIDISEDSASIENFTDMSAVSSSDYWCDLRWVGQGVWPSKTKYYADDEILCCVQFINYYHEDSYDCSYFFEGKLYDPSGKLIEYVSAFGAIKKGDMQEYKCHFPAPAMGWDSRQYEFCCKVKPTLCDGIEKCCTFKVLPLAPDLVITSLWSDDSTIYYKVKNVGNKKAGVSNTSLMVDGVFEALDCVVPLESREEKTGSFDYTWNCTNTNDTIEVCADYADDVAESTESNNCQTKTWTCPDLTITDVWCVNNTMICYKIKNNGDKTAGSSNTSLTIDSLFKISDSVASLEPGVERTESFNYTWNCTNPGDTVTVCADYTDDVIEGNETNNCWNETLACPPDIWVSPASFDVRLPPDVVANYTLTIGNDWIGTLKFDVSASDVVTPQSGVTSQIGWPKTTGSYVESSPALGDIDGDGDIEVVVGSYDDKVYAWHHDGSTVAGWPKTTGDGVTSSPALGDIDGDGDIEVVVGSEDGRVYAWHHDGSTVAGWPKTTGSYVYSSPALGDIDGDGDIEVVVGSLDGKVYAWHHDGSTVTGWSKTTGGYVESSPALGDIDGDGDIEVVVGSEDGKVYAWHHDGSTVAGWPKATGSYVCSSPALGDIDGDGDIEVVVGSYDDKVYAWHHNGFTVSGWPKTTGDCVYSSPALGDIDGDGDIEVVVGSYDDKVYAWHHDGSTVAGWPKTTGWSVDSSPALGDIDGDGDVEIVVGSKDDKVYARHHDGSTVAGWPKATGCDVYSSPALGDIDGDGDVEIVVGSKDGDVYAWHHDGSTVSGWPKKTGYYGVSSSPALGDIDGDGDIEVVVGSYDGKVYAWHHDGSTVTGWPKTTGDYVWSSPALGDIDGDGDIEVVVGSYDDKVYAWHHDGSAVAGWPKTTGNSVRSSPALGDIDGDGDIEVVVGSNDKKVYAWHHDGSAVAGWPKRTGCGVYSSPALGDIDGDGDIEVVVGSGDNVYVWDCSGIYNPNNIEWGAFHHDVRHTGLYEAMPKVGWLSEYPTNGTVNPGSQTEITVTFSATGLHSGNYHANITLTSNDPDENPVIIPVRLTVTSTPAQKGDLNHDDQITPADAAIALRIAATGAHDDAADVSGDGNVTSLDAFMILQAAAGAIEL